MQYVAPLNEPNGEIGYCLVGMDITEARRREEALKASREKLAMAVSATGMGMWEMDLATGVTTWDERMHEITGQPEPLGMEPFFEQVMHPEDRAGAIEYGRELMETGRFGPSINRIILPGGEVRWILTSGTIVEDENGEPVKIVGGMVDVTAQQSTEEQLRQAQKMQAIGNLTAGVAHNFNNMLMVLMPSLDLLGPVVPSSHRELLDDARHTAKRAATMIRQLMTFAGQTSPKDRGDVSISDVIAESVRMARQTLGHRLKLRTHWEDVPPVRGDASDLQQVLLNILLNARDALEGEDIEEPAIDIHLDQTLAHRPGASTKSRFVRIRVHDNGVGIEAELIPQVFEPFFTTKTATGTGLGLSTSYAIVREHSGWIECTSVVGEGTDFTVYLPVAKSSETSPTETSSENKRVLLVDDDEYIRRIVLHVLKREYEVVAVSSVDEATELLQGDTAFDLTLLDCSMPGGDGRQIVPLLREAMPGSPILYFTGEKVTDGDVVDGVLSKPVTESELISRVARALEERRD
jgi:PAS domain S-box-containing protein